MAEPPYSIPETSLSYRDAGVDIDAGNELVRRIGPHVKATHGPQVIGGLGGFAGLFELQLEGYRQPVLVSGTDGVGTKLLLARDLDRHDTIGIDLVAMCVNDIVVTGARPLLFLDYYATSRLDIDTASEVIKGISTGCRIAGAALIGGETAEMPGLYGQDDYDLAGFAVGIVEREEIIDGRKVRPGDSLIGIASSGPHSNGFSLIRRVLEVSNADLQSPLEDRTLGEVLLAPTRIYVKSMQRLLSELPVHALCHITGGGLPENLPRVLPAGTGARIRLSTWQRPAVFDWLQNRGGIEADEMLRAFNCGIGMVACVPSRDADEAVAVLNDCGETAQIIGEVVACEDDRRVEIAQ